MRGSAPLRCDHDPPYSATLYIAPAYREDDLSCVNAWRGLAVQPAERGCSCLLELVRANLRRGIEEEDECVLDRCVLVLSPSRALGRAPSSRCRGCSSATRPGRAAR